VYASRTAARPADGVSLVGGAVRAIPPDAWQDADAGIAAALSWPAAVESGLLDQCLRLAVRRAFDPGRSGAAVDLDSLPPDEVSEHYRSLLDLAGQKVVVSDVTALPAIPTFAFRLDGDLVAYRAGLTATEAIRDGLRATLQAYQSRSSGQPDHAPAAIAVDPHLSQRPSGDRRETLVRALLDAGRVPVVVPLGDDPAVREALPHVLRVVLVDD
jgi:hypothetical protein